MPMGRRRLSNHHLPPHMRFKHGAYYYDCKGKWEWLSRDLKVAKLKWAQIESSDVEPEHGTFAALARTYKTDVLPGKSKATQELHNICINKLVTSFGHMKPSAIKPHHIYAYLDANPAKIAGNRQLSTMSLIFDLGIRKGLLSANPCKQVRRNKEKPRDRYIEDHEFKAVKQLASFRFQFIMDFAYMTAMRRGDILSLRMDAITDEGINVRQGKTGKRQLIEWTTDLRFTVATMHGMGPPLRPTLVCNLRGMPFTPGGFSVLWRRLMARAVDEGVERFTFHDIRAKSLTDAQKQGLDPQRLAGHTTAQQTATYLRSKTIDRIQPVRSEI